MIATRNRYEKLMRTLRSIPNTNVNVYLVFDGDKRTYDLFQDERLYTAKFLVSKNMGAVWCRNQVIKHCEDGVLYATDDITFETNSIHYAFNTFNRTFSDDDGVVGFRQIPDSFHPTGVALVGQKFLQRYPDKQLFWPGYHHFACQEIHWLADKLGRFHQEKTAIIRHYHPDFFPGEMDETHREARIYREKDHALIKARQMTGTIWGLK